GMVHARLPEHVLAAHALEADENILQRVVEGVPHMERAGHIWRRNDDAEAGRPVDPAGSGAKGIGLFPGGADALLDAAGVVGFLEHGAALADRCSCDRSPSPRWGDATLG